MNDSASYITTSGGLISQAFIENIRGPESKQRGMEPERFELPWATHPKTSAKLEEHIAVAWDLLLERWDAISNQVAMFEISQVRSRWLMPLFELLDFQPQYIKGDTVIGEDLRFDLSYRGWEGETVGPVLHSVMPQQGLDERQRGGHGGSMKTKSPHDMLQAYLNLSPQDDWAILTNGIMLRLLRDYHHTFTQGYVQFDLENIFETRNFADFRALYRLCHASRFMPLDEEAEEDKTPVPLERFYKESIASGIKVGEDLRDQVREAIETLGNGFLRKDPALLQTLQSSEETLQDYYAEILRVIYRVLFLLFVEQRGMLPGRGSLYAEAYSISRLREKAEREVVGEDDHTDLWEGLKVTFRMVREGAPELKVFGYDGMLFEDHPQNGESPLLTERTCRNSELLLAIRALTLIEKGGVLQRISFADLGVEELGSIYESLLDFTPRVTTNAEEIEGRAIQANTFYLDPRGSARKTTGSYYTHSSLVNELIKSALLPVLRDLLERAGLPVIPDEEIGEMTGGMLVDYTVLTEGQMEVAEEAILNIKVCDPAAGSGHFLIKANDTLAAELARIRTGQEYPSQDEIQNAKHGVLVHCIYAVDVNPMAVELCKVALWINASVKDKPLSFLDHHIKCGNSLIGTTPELMADGIPHEAFSLGLTGDDREVAKAIRARNRQERSDYEKSGRFQMPLRIRVEREEAEERSWEEINQLADADPKRAREAYADYLADQEYQRKKLEADFWTAAFFWPMPDPEKCDQENCGLHGPNGELYAPTFGEFEVLRSEGIDALPASKVEIVKSLAAEHRFFHWHLEFCDVFSGDDGFAVVLGNPPWERVKLQEKEFFEERAPEVANAHTAARRRQMITELKDSNPQVFLEYLRALKNSEWMSEYLRTSGRFPLTAVGDVNTYQVFSGLTYQIVDSDGRVGVVLPTGIITDYHNQGFANRLINERKLASLFDFENRRKIFPDVEGNKRFCLLTISGSPSSTIRMACQLKTVDELSQHGRKYPISPEDVIHINPNTLTLPMFKSLDDAALIVKIYSKVRALVMEEAENSNPWGIEFLRMFDMTNDSDLFEIRFDLIAKGFKLHGNWLILGTYKYSPLYEAKLCHQYNHRHATFEGVPDDSLFGTHAGTNSPRIHNLKDPTWLPIPRYWISSRKVQEAIPEFWNLRWFIGFRNAISAVADSRSVSFSILPFTGIGNSQPVMLTSKSCEEACALVANFNTFIVDYVARQKVGGSNLNFYIVKQLPILFPNQYTHEALEFIIPRILELCFTAWDMKPFADDLWRTSDESMRSRLCRQIEMNTASTKLENNPQPPIWLSSIYPIISDESFPYPPFTWNEERRMNLQYELDALYAHFYGIDHGELAYILDMFTIVRRMDEERYGEFRTKRLILECFDQLTEENWVKEVRSK